jgi:hypothetical protein
VEENVELPGSIYLYALATVSITFVGFSALLIVFRQSMGGELTRYDTYFTLSFIQAGFIVTAGALVPPLLALFEWSHDVVWRISSTVIAIPILWFVVSVPARRRAATRRPVPAFVWALLSVQAAAALALVLRAAGRLDAPAGAVYALAITAMLFASGIAYLLALSVILPELTNRTK